MSGGFRDQDDDDDFRDIITSNALSSSTALTFPNDDDLSSNPFADMESSRSIYAAAASPFEPTGSSAGVRRELSDAESSSAASLGDTDYAQTFSREMAPEPESPTQSRGSSPVFQYNRPSPSNPSPISPSSAVAVEEQTPFGSPPPLPLPFQFPDSNPPLHKAIKPDIQVLLGEEKPVLPKFTRSEGTSPIKRGASGDVEDVLPVSSTGRKPVKGALATLLGMEDSDEEEDHLAGKDKEKAFVPPPTTVKKSTPAPIPAPTPTPTAKSTATKPIPVPISTSKANASVRPTPSVSNDLAPTSIPLPPSRSGTPPPSPPTSHSHLPSRSSSQAPSITSESSMTPNRMYDSIVSPMDTGDDTATSLGERNGGTPTGREDQVEGLGERLESLKVDHQSQEEADLPQVVVDHSTPTKGSNQDFQFDQNETQQSPFGQNGFEDVVAPPQNSLRVSTANVYANNDDGASLRGNYSRSVEEAPEHVQGFREDGLHNVAVERDAEQSRNQVNRYSPSPTVPTLAAAQVSPRSKNLGGSLGPSFVITVGDPQKVGSSLNVAAQHTVYTVRTKTTSSAFRKPEFSVLRRFSHFLWLFDALTQNNPGVIVPGMPEKSAIGRFGSEFVENRRSGLQAALMKIVSHPMLVGDPDLRLFLESDSFSVDIKQRKLDTPVENKGFLASFSSSLSGPKFQEVDEYFEQRRSTLDAFELQLRALLASLTNSAKVRLSLQNSLAELQAALVGLSLCDVGTPLRGALEHAAGVQKRLRELGEQQSLSEEQIGGLTSVAEGYARLCASVKLVFGARVKSYHAWQAAESNLRKVKSAHEKAKKSGRTHSELLGLSLSEITDAERKALDGKQDFEDVSKLTKAELARFDQEKIDDFKKAVEEYVDGLVVRQREIVSIWQAYCEALQRIVDASLSGNEGAVGHRE